MKIFRNIIVLIILFSSAKNTAQLGFCTGSKGDAIFSENFGNGTNYGPALPAGFTNYPFVVAAPNDGFYTLFCTTNLYSTWHYSLDHTSDATNGVNGKALIVNANASTSGDFYKRTVTGLCINTTFEFSAWVMNIYNPGSNFCGASEIPINVRFEIWNDTETVLLGSGNTGNIIGTSTPLWQQFALVFTTTNQTTAVLKMKNNGLGGCGNDLAIDDIEFRACGDLTTITSPGIIGSNFITCQNPVSILLNANTSGSAAYVYQWQSSIDNINWVNIAGENGPSYTTPNLTSPTLYRTKIAQDLVNINNNFCSAISNVFSIAFSNGPNPAISNGNKTICSNETIPALTVSSALGTNINWYSAATGGTLLQSNSIAYIPTTSGTYYAEVYDIISNCKSATRTAVALTIETLPAATISATTTICSGSAATITFTGTPNAVVIYTIDGGLNQTQTLNNSGQAAVIIPTVTSTKVINLVSVSSGSLASCIQNLSQSITINVTLIPTATISATSLICSGSAATITFTGTPNAVVIYTIDSGLNQTQTLNNSGQAAVIIPTLTSTKVINLVSVSSGSLASCIQNLSQSITINVNPTPTATILATSPICSGSSAIITFTGTPNAVVTYTIDGGLNQTQTLSTSGQASVIIPNVTSTKSITLIRVSSAVSSVCSQNATQSITINVIALPTATISINPSVICSDQNTTLTFTGSPSANVFYTTNNANQQSVVLDASGNATVLIANLNTTTTYELTRVSFASTSCSQLLLGAATVTVNQVPTASFSGNLRYCSGETTSIALQSNRVGTTFSWTATQNNATGVSSDSGTQINQTLQTISDSNGNVTYIVTPEYNGCSGNPIPINVVVNALPVPVLQEGVICLFNTKTTSSQPFILNTALNSTGYSFQWFFEGNLIPNAFGNSYEADQIGHYAVIATNSDTSCISNLVATTVSEAEKGEDLVIQQSEAFSNSPTIVVTVVGGLGPFLYQIDHSNFQPSNTFYNLSAGNHTIKVIDEVNCTDLTTTVTILDYPKFFTPNEDGYNDTWNISGLNAATKIMIYDRYGKLIKQISTNGLGWDGTYNGHLMVATDYWFTVTYLEKNVEKIFRAHFSLKR